MLRHRVVATASPRVATQQSSDGQVETAYRAVLAQCLYRIARAGWREATRRGLEWRYAQLVEAHQADKRQGSYALNRASQLAPELCRWHFRCSYMILYPCSCRPEQGLSASLAPRHMPPARLCGGGKPRAYGA